MSLAEGAGAEGMSGTAGAYPCAACWPCGAILHALRSVYHRPLYSLLLMPNETFTLSPTLYFARSLTLSCPHTENTAVDGKLPSWNSTVNSCFAHSPRAERPVCGASLEERVPSSSKFAICFCEKSLPGTWAEQAKVILYTDYFA